MLEKIRDVKLEPDEKVKREVIKISIIRIFLAIAMPIWLARFINFISKKSRNWNNKAWRDRERVYFLVFCVGVAGCWLAAFIVLALIMQGVPSALAQFWGTWILSCIILNPFSKRWLKPDFEKFIVSKMRLTLIDAPDANKNGFPVGWNKKYGWIFYDFRTPNDPPEHFPRHLVVFGNYGYGQQAFALNCIRAAFEVLNSPVILILDSDAGGIDFSVLKMTRGVLVYDMQSECERAIWYTAQIVKRRRKLLELNAPNIIIVADMWFGAAMIGKNPELAHLRGSIEEIVENGGLFGVNIVAFPPAQYHYAVIAGNLRCHYDRVQFFTQERYKIKRATGELIEKNIESPRAFIDLFLWTKDGETCECKQLVPTMEQVVSRINIAYYDDNSKELWNKFAMFNFVEFPKMPKPDEARAFGQKKNLPYIGPPRVEYAPQPQEIADE